MDGGPDPVDGGTDAGPPGPCGDVACGIWRLGPAATTWDAWPLGDTTFAPSTPVRAAFDLESVGVAYILTDTTYHVLRLSDRAWTSDGARNTLFPQAAGAALLLADSIPANHVGGDGVNEGVNLQSASAVYLYSMQLDDRSVNYGDTVTDFGAAWEAALAPVRSALRFGWLDVTNARDWAVGNPSALCGAGSTTMGPYGAVVTGAATHLIDLGYCGEFFDRVSHPTFAPFAMAGAPDPAEIGAAFWNQGSLWLIAE